MTNLIIRLPTDNPKNVQHFVDKFQEDDNKVLIIPSNIPILIKRENGLWEEIKND